MPFTKNSFFNTTWATVITSFIAIAIAITALSGWIFNYEILKNFNPGWATIKVNTALGILFSASSLLLFATGKRKAIAFILAGLVFLIGIISLFEYAFNWNAHIDELFFVDKNPTSLYPGRMAKASAEALVITSLSLFFCSRDKKTFIRISEWLAILVFIFSLTTFVSYFYKATQFFKAIELTTVSLPTVLSGLSISLGILFSRPGKGMLSVFNNKTIAAKLGLRGILVATILIVLLGWLRIKSEETNIFDKTMGISIMAITFSIIFFFSTWIFTKKLNIAQENLQKNQQELSLLVNSIEGIVWEADAKTFQFSFVSKKAEKLLGYPLEKWIKEPSFRRDHIHPDDREWAVNYCIQSTRNKLPHEFEYRMIAADGNIIWVRDFVTVLLDDNQDPFRLHGIMVDITESKKAEKQLEESYQSIRNLTEHLQTAKEEERKTIAREIHDDLGQQLAVLKMDIDWISKMGHPEDKATKQKLENLIGLTDNMVKAVRKIYSGLRPSLLDDMGLAAAIDWHLSEFGKHFSINTHFIEPDHELELTDAVKTGLFRIFQESMTNVARHAEAENITVALEKHNGNIIMSIEDDGKGFEKDNIAGQKTLGILGMKERCLMLGGTYEIGSIQSRGTTITVTIPIRN